MVNSTPRCFNIPAQPETEMSVLAELDQLEGQLATELRIHPRMLRQQLVQRLRAGEIVETALVAKWLAAYQSVLEYTALS